MLNIIINNDCSIEARIENKTPKGFLDSVNLLNRIKEGLKTPQKVDSANTNRSNEAKLVLSYKEDNMTIKACKKIYDCVVSTKYHLTLQEVKDITANWSTTFYPTIAEGTFEEMNSLAKQFDKCDYIKVNVLENHGG